MAWLKTLERSSLELAGLSENTGKGGEVLPRTDIKPLRHRMPVEWAARLGSALHHGRFFSIVFLCGLLCSSQLLLPQITPQSPWNSCFDKASGSALRRGSVRLTSLCMLHLGVHCTLPSPDADFSCIPSASPLSHRTLGVLVVLCYFLPNSMMYI